MSSTSPVCVVGDDLGMSPAINDGILLAFEMGLITNASLMANMPYFDDAVTRIHERGFAHRIGAHLNLTEGSPLTEGIRRCPQFVDADGQFCWRHHLVLSLSQDELKAIYTELSAQAAKIQAAGIPLSHIDSHQHVHISWAILPMVLAVAKELGVTPVRLARTCRNSLLPQRKLYNRVVNTRLRLRKHTDFQHFGAIEEAATILHVARGPVEVMVHPLINDAGALCDMKPDRSLADLLAPLNLGSRMKPLLSR